MANTKVTTRVIADDAITSDKLASGLTLGGSTTFSGNINLTSTTPILDLIASANEDANIRIRENGTGVVGAELLYDGGNNRFDLKLGNNTNTTRLSIARDTGVATFTNGIVASDGITATAGTGTVTATTFSGALSGTIASATTATTQSASDNSTKVATTAYVDGAISDLVDSSPSALNTLNELAAALGDDANFSTTVTNSIATKAALAGATFTGNVVVPYLATTSYIDLNNSGNRGKVGFDSNHTYIATTSSVGSIIFKNNVGSTDAPQTGGDTLLTLADGGDATFAGNITLAEYLYHSGNTGTNLRFQTDRATLTSGGGAIVDAHSNGNLYLTGTTVQVYGNYNSSGTISSGAITSTAAVSADHFKFYQNSSASGATESIHRNTTGQITIRASSEDLVRVDGANEMVQIGGLPAGNVQTHGVVATNKVRATLGNTIGDTMRVFAVHGQTANSDFLTFRARRITDGQSGWNHSVWDITRDVDNTSDLYQYLTFGIGELAVNDLSNDLDFRVESNTNSHALFVNGGNNSVGINSSNPDGALTVNGTPTSGDLIARFQHGTNGNNVKGIRVNAPNASGTQAYADFAVDPETGNLGIGAGTSSGNLPIGQANMNNAAIVITSPAGAAGTGEAIDFQPGETHTRTVVREQHHFGAGDVYVLFRRFIYSASAFTNPTKNIITFTRSGNYPQGCVYARVRQMGVSNNRAVLAEGFISVEKDSTASSWDVDYATMNNGTTGYSDSTNSFWPIARIGTSVTPDWYTSISGDSITVGITFNRSTNYDRYIVEAEVFYHQNMTASWEA